MDTTHGPPFSESAHTLLRALRIKPETIVQEGVAQGIISGATDLADPAAVHALEGLLERFADELVEAKHDAEALAASLDALSSTLEAASASTFPDRLDGPVGDAIPERPELLDAESLRRLEPVAG